MNENRLSGTATVLIRRAAEDLISEVNGVRAVVVATADGFDVTSAMRGHQEPSRIAAMASSIAAISLVVSQEARLGRHRSVTIDTDDGFAVVYAVPGEHSDLIINAIAGREAIIGQVMYRLGAMARHVAELEAPN